MFEGTGFGKQQAETKTSIGQFSESTSLFVCACIMTEGQHLANVNACPVISNFIGQLWLLLNLDKR